MQLALAGFLDKHTAGFMRRCAVITAGPYTPVHPLTHPANPLAATGPPVALAAFAAPRLPPAPVAPPRVSLTTSVRRSCQVRGWRTRDRKTTASKRPVPATSGTSHRLVTRAPCLHHRRDLWSLLISAQEMPGGVPREFVEKQARRTRTAPAPDLPRTRPAPASPPPRPRPAFTCRAAQEEALRVQKEAQERIGAALQATKQEFEAQACRQPVPAPATRLLPPHPSTPTVHPTLSPCPLTPPVHPTCSLHLFTPPSTRWQRRRRGATMRAAARWRRAPTRRPAASVPRKRSGCLRVSRTATRGASGAARSGSGGTRTAATAATAGATIAATTTGTNGGVVGTPTTAGITTTSATAENMTTASGATAGMSGATLATMTAGQ